MVQLAVKARTLFALGFVNIGRVFLYRLGIKLGVNPLRRLSAQLPSGPFFRQVTGTVTIKPSTAWREQTRYFGWFPVVWSGTCPDWHVNPFNGCRVARCDRPWWQISDFDPKVGDIKTVWEASRFDWVLSMAQRALAGEAAELDCLNGWLSDWARNNPAYKGPNWKCGQEASIRVMHLAMAAHMLGQTHKTKKALLEMVRIHLERIEPTLGYAIAQDNNHGTSEAAALYIGGSWLSAQGDKGAEKYQKIGVKWLENRAGRLIEEDGSFSQYSTNYHRVILDTYSMVEFWRQSFQLPAFSCQLYERLNKACNWLYHMTLLEKGDVPNLGANDGARLFPLTETDYRDYRPSVQLASVLFAKERAYRGEGDWNLPLQWLSIKLPKKLKKPPEPTWFSQGGYSTLHAGKAFAVFNIPRFRFRPSQADALHVDLWLNGENVLRDAGTYSYNTGDEVTRYFDGTASHNTIQFDDRDQMPSLSRFLFGAWLKAEQVIPVTEQNGKVTTVAAYHDYQGAFHHRTVTLSDRSLKVTDKISGFKHKAVLRWRLQPGKWRIQDMIVSNGIYQLRVTSNVSIVRFEITQGWESRYYMKKTPLPVLEVEIVHSGELITKYQFRQ